VGNDVPVSATFADAGDSDDENVVVSFGDGEQASVKAGPNSFNLLSDHLPKVTSTGPNSWNLVADHVYSQPGIYYGTVTVSDWGGGTSTSTFTVTVTGSQQITFPGVGDHIYGQSVNMGATGTASGSPVTYTAGPATVCTLAPDDSDTVKLVGVGQCAVTAYQAADPPVFAAAPDVTQTFSVTPAPLTIIPYDLNLRAGTGTIYSWQAVGWVNGDSASTLGVKPNASPTCLATDGGVEVSSKTPPGLYPITCSGATDGDYAIDYTTARLRVDAGVTLSQTGLSKADAAVAATVSGQPVTLPDLEWLAFPGTISYAFAPVIIDASGVVHLTSQAPYNGPVNANMSVTATYATVPQAIRGDRALRLVTASGKTRLLKSWAQVKVALKAKNLPAEQSALHAFAGEVPGRTTGTARTELLADAQAVYAYLGGAGSV
jgi:hypothetical protein